MTLIASQFLQQRYAFLGSFLSVPDARALYQYALDLVKRIQWQSDRLVPDTPALYGEPRMEELLVTLLPRIEEASSLSLYPTYSYLRVYKRGDILPRHRDRPSCEIS